MKPETKLKLQNILFIISIGLIFGLVYNYLFYPHSLTEFIEAASISILIGLMIGWFEEFMFKDFFRKLTFPRVTLIRTLLYSFFISIILCLVLSIEISFIENLSYTEAVIQYLQGPLFLRDFAYSFLFIVLILIIFQSILFIGKANFFRLIFGWYHKPRELGKVFMFLDLKNSTSIAEQMENINYSAFIRDFFNDLSDAIIMYKGEVYQYVGDEIIVMWPLKEDNLISLQCFFKMKEIIQRNKQYYLKNYNQIPEFKAGIHAGKVIVTQVGKQKKEIVYHGDVLNTTSRIEGECNKLNQDVLISEDLMHSCKVNDYYTFIEMGQIELKGKTKKLNLFGVRL